MPGPQRPLITEWGYILTYRWKEVNALPSHMTSRLRQQISIGWYNKLRNGNGISNRDCMCGRPHGQRFWTLTPSGGGDVEIQKACLKFTMLWRLVYAYVTIRLSFHYGLTEVIGEKIRQWISCGTWLKSLRDGQNSTGWWLKCPCLISI